MNIGLTFPTKNRVEKVKRLILSIKNSLKPNSHIVHFCLALNVTDIAVKDYLKLAHNFECDNLKFHFIYMNHWRGLGFSFNVICKDLPKEVETISMFGDDMIIPESQKVFDKIEDTLMRKWAPDHIGAIWFNDGTPHNFQCTNPIAINGFVHVNWYKALGIFVPGEFIGDYSDNWLSDTARALGRFEVVRDLKIPHLHVLYNPSENDKTARDKIAYEKQIRYKASMVWGKQISQTPKTLEKLRKFIEQQNGKIV